MGERRGEWKKSKIKKMRKRKSRRQTGGKEGEEKKEKEGEWETMKFLTSQTWGFVGDLFFYY